MTYKDLYVKLLQRLEGFASKPYKDFHQWSIGYGMYAGDLQDHEGNPIPAKIQSITKDQAIPAMTKKADGFDKQYIIPNLKVPVTDGQHAALVSMTYNYPKLGVLITGMMNKGAKPEEIHAKMKQYVIAGGKVNDTLVDRRETEFKCFQTGTW